MPHSKHSLLEKHVQEMLADDIIEKSTSPFNSPLFMVPKSKNEWRPVADFRDLSKITVPPCCNMPILEEILQTLGDDNCVFSTVGLCSGF